MCCGYPDRLDRIDYPKADPGSYLRHADAIEDTAIDAISIEDAHRPNDPTLLDRFRRTTVILGVVAIAKSRVESIEEIARRIGAALGHIDAHRLDAAPRLRARTAGARPRAAQARDPVPCGPPGGRQQDLLRASPEPPVNHVQAGTEFKA